jgi:pimeloyl-ACP methyl ester carboxylesterase
MVDIGGYQLHIYCTGRGTPTVVLEAPAAGLSAAWGRVQPQVARRTRVCSYDRAGLGWSERSDAAYEPAAVPGHLHALLAAANEHGPYVIVGHGLGAAFARLFASRFTDETAAVVLVDRPEAGAATANPGPIRYAPAWPWLARAGVLRASGVLAAHAREMPGPEGGALRAFLNRPDHLTRTADELKRWSETVALAAGASAGANVPVLELEVGDPASRLSFLATAQDADRVVAAIVQTVDRVAAGRAGPAAATPGAP